LPAGGSPASASPSAMAVRSKNTDSEEIEAVVRRKPVALSANLRGLFNKILGTASPFEAYIPSDKYVY
jgi:hypothetical protein